MKDQTPHPFVICHSVIEEHEPQICNEWKIDPCTDCPLVEIISRFKEDEEVPSCSDKKTDV